MKERATINFADALDDLTGFNNNLSVVAPRAATEQSQAAAEQAGFRSREPVVVEKTQPRKQRRRRTGRTQQLNIKVTPEFAERFYQLVDDNEWTVGESFEKAVVLLEKELELV